MSKHRDASVGIISLNKMQTDFEGAGGFSLCLMTANRV